MKKKLDAIYIVSLKKFYKKENELRTYGGFPIYLKMLESKFRKIILIVPKSPLPFESSIKLNNKIYEVKFLPYYSNELLLILKSPIIIFWLLIYLLPAKYVNPRIPDMTGIYGLIISIILKKKIFISIQSDIQELIQSKNFTSRNNFIKYGLKKWLSLYLFLEKNFSRNILCFPQGVALFNRFSSNKKAILWYSTSIKDSFIDKNKKLFNLDKKLRILNIGRFCIQKNQSLLLDSIKILDNISNTSFICSFCGKKDQRIFKELNNYVKENNLKSKVIFLDTKSSTNKLISIYDQNDIFILTSLWEGTPKVLIEALARGLLVIVPRLGGIKGIIKDRENGFYFNSYNPIEISSLILEVNNLSIEEKNLVSKKAKQTAAFYTYKKQRDILITNIEKYLN